MKPAEGDAEERLRAAVDRDLRRNYGSLVVHGLLGQTGFRLIHAPTFIPAYVFALSGSELAVGLVRAAQSLGMFLSPVLGATLIEHRSRTLPALFTAGGLMRLQILGIALSGFFLAPSLSLPAVVLFLGLFGFFLGMQGVFFNVLVAKIIPVRRRGILMGTRNALSGVVSAAVGLLGGYWVESNALGNGYATTFLVAFVLTTLGLLMLPLMREPSSPTVRAQSGLLARLGDLPALMRGDRAYTRYFLARSLGTLGRMSMPFYWIYATTRVELSGADLGITTGAFVLGQSVTNLLWGVIADRRGFRLVFLLAVGLWVGSALLLLQTTASAGLIAVFAGLGAGIGGFQMSAQNLVLEFGSRSNLPLRIAAANSGSELTGAVGWLLGGALASTLSLPVVFWVAIAFQVASLVLMLGVADPRARASA